MEQSNDFPSKTIKVLYWIATIWLCLGMVSSGVVQLLRMQDEITLFTHLGYPLYFMTIIGAWKMLGVVAVLAPGFPIIKEWAYAGFFFTATGAFISHLAVGGETVVEFIGPALLTVLTVASWYLRPRSRKLA